MEEIKKEESWNKKRIIAVLFLIILLAVGGYFFKTRILDTKSISFSNPFKSVKGVSVGEKNGDGQNLNTNIQEAVREKINSLKQEVSGLNIVEIASSSPQIQKIINDIKLLEQYPTNQAKEICRKVCGL